jgi:hypothetical protein
VGKRPEHVKKGDCVGHLEENTNVVAEYSDQILKNGPCRVKMISKHSICSRKENMVWQTQTLSSKTGADTSQQIDLLHSIDVEL